MEEKAKRKIDVHMQPYEEALAKWNPMP